MGCWPRRFRFASAVLLVTGALALPARAGDGDDPEDVMYPQARSQRVPGLSERDRNTLRALYERPIGSRPTRGGRAAR